MQKRERDILNIFAEQVRNLYPKAQIWAFGSYVRGEATFESDLDVCVVIPDMQPDDRLVISDIAWEVGFAHDLHLATIVISKEKLDHGAFAANPLLQAIRDEGVAA